ncbi:MAG: MBOAT family protein [Synergistaceae bacterium]|nr:MBOAT family protein [Synergistaceae bacterium]
MSFSSYEFIFLFLPITLTIFFTLPAKLASIWLIIASLFFYGTLNLQSLPLLIISVIVNYVLSLRVSRSRVVLILGLAFNFGLLACFKLIDALPLGISFWTFTQSAYLVDVYRGGSGASGLAEYGRHVTFFGCITSGPIARFNETCPKFTADYDAIARGLTLFVLGLFKKAAIADGLAKTVNVLFAASGILTFFEAWLAGVGYAMQLYFDFSGYSDMAIGIGLMFGMSLPQNFASPYKSLSIIDFWRRWHMSLGAWVRDYLYIPLGGSRCGELKRTRNVMLAMLFTGLWHGLGWTFVVWGAVHGVLLAVNHWWRKHGVKIPVIVSWVMTFAAVVMLWVMFRAESLNEAGKIFASMVDLRNIALPAKLSGYLGFLENWGISFVKFVPLEGGFFKNSLYVFALMLWTLFAPNTQQVMAGFRPSAKWVVVVAVLAVMAFWNFSGISDFLYFRF